MTKKKTIYDRLFDIFFIAYVTCVFCFNDSTSGIKYVYISMLLVTGTAFLSLISGGTKLNIKTELLLLVLYLFYGCLVSMKAVYSVYYASQMVKTLAACIISSIVICYYFMQRKDNQIFPIALSIAGIIMSVYIIISYGGLSSFYHQASKEGARLGQEIRQVNGLGLQAAYAIIAMLYLGLTHKKYYLCVLSVIPFLIAVATGSRNSLIMIALSIPILYFISNKSTNVLANILKVVFFLAFLIVIVTFLSELPIMRTILKRMDGLFNLFKTGTGDNSTNIRRRMISAGLEYFPQHPILGVGLNNARFVCLKYVGYFTYLHSDYVEQLVNLGIIGVVMYYGNILIVLKKSMLALNDPKRKTLLSVVTLLAFLLTQIGNVSYYQKLTYLFWAYWISSIYIREDCSE